MAFSHSPPPVEPQNLNLEQYQKYIDLMCEFLNLHKLLDELTNQKFPVKQALLTNDLDEEKKVTN